MHEVQWDASSSSKWLVLEQSSGTVSSLNPVVAINVLVIGSGQNDTAVRPIHTPCKHALVHAPAHTRNTPPPRCHSSQVSGPLRSWIEVNSSMRGRSDLFERGSSSLQMAVVVIIEAAVALTTVDVLVVDQDGDAVADSSKVETGSALTLTASAFDSDRLPICRTTLLIAVELSQPSGARNNTLPMQHQYGNTYQVVLPTSWIVAPGPYTLWIDSGAVMVQFTATDESMNDLYLAAGLAATVAVLLILFVVLVYRGQGSWKKRVTSVLKPVASVGTVSMEVWDIYGDTSATAAL